MYLLSCPKSATVMLLYITYVCWLSVLAKVTTWPKEAKLQGEGADCVTVAQYSVHIANDEPSHAVSIELLKMHSRKC